MSKKVYKLTFTDSVNFYAYVVADSAKDAETQYRKRRMDYRCDEEETVTRGPCTDEFDKNEDDFAEKYIEYCLKQDAAGELCLPYNAWHNEVHEAGDDE